MENFGIVERVSLSSFVYDMVEEGFTVQGAEELYNYLEDLAWDMQESIDYDIVAIRCDYSEYTKYDFVLEYIDSETLEKLEQELREDDELEESETLEDYINDNSVTSLRHIYDNFCLTELIISEYSDKVLIREY